MSSDQRSMASRRDRPATLTSAESMSRALLHHFNRLCSAQYSGAQAPAVAAASLVFSDVFSVSPFFSAFAFSDAFLNFFGCVLFFFSGVLSETSRPVLKS